MNRLSRYVLLLRIFVRGGGTHGLNTSKERNISSLLVNMCICSLGTSEQSRT